MKCPGVGYAHLSHCFRSCSNSLHLFEPKTFVVASTIPQEQDHLVQVSRVLKVKLPGEVVTPSVGLVRLDLLSVPISPLTLVLITCLVSRVSICMSSLCEYVGLCTCVCVYVCMNECMYVHVCVCLC